MTKFTPKTFSIPSLKGISAKNIEEHLKLYAGYVKHANLINEKIEELCKDPEKNSYIMCELMRRFSFEYNGMRNHEVYFDSLSGGAAALADDSPLRKAIEKEWGYSGKGQVFPGVFDGWLASFKAMALTRGIGWAVLWQDRQDGRLIMSWLDEQHLGQLQNCVPVLALDMWEHSYVADYQPSGKKQYVEDFFENLNWAKVEANFDANLSGRK